MTSGDGGGGDGGAGREGACRGGDGGGGDAGGRRGGDGGGGGAVHAARGTFRPDDVALLLTDITGTIAPKPAEERERLIQGGVHYSEMLPLESEPSPRYVAEYRRALGCFAEETALAVAAVAEKIYAAKGKGAVLVSLARAGTPAGVLAKRYLRRMHGFDAPHYAVSIVRGRGIDAAAMRHILARHPAADVQFIDGWTGKGAILDELHRAARAYFGEQDKRRLLAVVADPANVTDMCGTREDIPIASSFLNSAACGLMSRTIVRPGIGPDEFHGVAFFEEFRGQDRTYEFIEHIEGYFARPDALRPPAGGQPNCAPGPKDGPPLCAPSPADAAQGADEVRGIAERFGIADTNFVKPGIGETTRVLLRRVPDMVLIAENAERKYISHLIQLAQEKRVPVVRYPLRRYRACGIIKTLAPDI